MKNWLPGIISIDLDEGESDLLTLKIICKYLVTPIDAMRNSSSTHFLSYNNSTDSVNGRNLYPHC